MTDSGDPDGGPDVAIRRQLTRTTVWCWVWAFLAFTVWSIATPLWTSPDAPAHDLMAYHVVRDLTVERTDIQTEDSSTNAITRGPRGLVDSAKSVDCYLLRWDTPASCLRAVTDDATPVEFVNPLGRNLPTYYLATGWPSLLVSPSHAVWADRVAASALAALMVAWSFSAAMTRRRRSWAVTGVVVALTPMTMYLGAAVNPNSLEIVSGLALASCSLVFLQDGPQTWLGRVMFRRAMLAATVMVTIRMLAPVWVLAWAVAFAVLATRRHWQHVFSRRAVGWTLLPVLGAAYDVVWTITSGVVDYQGEPKHSEGFWSSLLISQEQLAKNTVLHQVGDFGWLDTPMPILTYTYVFLVVGLVAVTAFVALPGRAKAAFAILLVAQYVAPIVLQALQYDANGIVWQGRYTLPLTVMLPVFLLGYAGAGLDVRDRAGLVRFTSWAYPVAVLALLAAHVQAMVAQLQRNVTGRHGDSFLHGPWEPPLLGALPLLLLHAALLVVVLVVVVRLFVDDRVRLDEIRQTTEDTAPAWPGRMRNPGRRADSLTTGLTRTQALPGLPGP